MLKGIFDHIRNYLIAASLIAISAYLGQAEWPEVPVKQTEYLQAHAEFTTWVRHYMMRAATNLIGLTGIFLFFANAIYGHYRLAIDPPSDSEGVRSICKFLAYPYAASIAVIAATASNVFLITVFGQI